MGDQGWREYELLMVSPGLGACTETRSHALPSVLPCSHTEFLDLQAVPDWQSGPERVPLSSWKHCVDEARGTPV